jgi:cell wall-associated NlpC family hydrolase
MPDIIRELSEGSYSLFNGPDVIRSPADVMKYGANCGGLAKVVVEAVTGVKLAPQRGVYEMSQDRQSFAVVPDGEPLRPGDLMWFGRDFPEAEREAFVPSYGADGFLLNWRQLVINHVGPYVGHSQDGPMVFHASMEAGGNVLSPVEEVLESDRHSKLWFVTRPLAVAAQIPKPAEH